MSHVQLEAPAVPRDDEAKYWETVRETLARVFGESPGLADEFRSEVEARPARERELALHSEPLDVAADLVGVTPTAQQVSTYLALRESIQAQGGRGQRLDESNGHALDRDDSPDQKTRERLQGVELEIVRLRSALDQARIESDTRSAALQYLVAQLFRQFYAIREIPDETIENDHRKVIELFKRYIHGGNDPALSDHISSEIEQWVRDTLNDVEELRRYYQSRGNLG